MEGRKRILAKVFIFLMIKSFVDVGQKSVKVLKSEKAIRALQFLSATEITKNQFVNNQEMFRQEEFAKQLEKE